MLRIIRSASTRRPSSIRAPAVTQAAKYILFQPRAARSPGPPVALVFAPSPPGPAWPGPGCPREGDQVLGELRCVCAARDRADRAFGEGLAARRSQPLQLVDRCRSAYRRRDGGQQPDELGDAVPRSSCIPARPGRAGWGRRAGRGASAPEFQGAERPGPSWTISQRPRPRRRRSRCRSSPRPHRRLEPERDGRLPPAGAPAHRRVAIFCRGPALGPASSVQR
jgi:hypothetical protein